MKKASSLTQHYSSVCSYHSLCFRLCRGNIDKYIPQMGFFNGVASGIKTHLSYVSPFSFNMFSLELHRSYTTAVQLHVLLLPRCCLLMFGFGMGKGYLKIGTDTGVKKSLSSLLYSQKYIFILVITKS